jgi:type III pantothenate kinase
MSHTLVVDVGNSRMKWALWNGRTFVTLGVVPNAEIGSLVVRDWQTLQRPVRAIGVNVAGESARVRVESQLARWRLAMEWLHATGGAGGVVNHYAQPSQLGADRWAALVAARRRALAADTVPRPVIVVNAGTAVTIDALDGQGVFRGGLILPGMRLMLRALAENTAALKLSPGRYADFPTSTPDALATGVVQAVCGAIELMRARLASGLAVAVGCYIAGGAAREIAPHLAAPVQVVDNLVLEGVLALAGET